MSYLLSQKKNNKYDQYFKVNKLSQNIITQEISIGDYVLSGGELPALVLTDSIVRLLPGAISDAESALEDSFQNGLLEPPFYTRPEDYQGYKVPDILLKGNHKEITEWKDDLSMEKTQRLRRDLLE